MPKFVGNVRETNRCRPVEIARAVGLHGENERHVESGRQRPRQTIRWYGRNSYSSTTRAVVAEERVCRHGDGDSFEFWILREDTRRKGDNGVARGTDGLQRSLHDQ